jgi:hypothetical protein
LKEELNIEALEKEANKMGGRESQIKAEQCLKKYN